jgi:hypothetical protein
VLTIKPIQALPAQFKLTGADPSGETAIFVRPATFGDEGARMTMLARFGNGPVAMTRVAAIELWLTLDACNIANEDTGEPMLRSGMSFDEFDQALTSIWRANPDVVWEMHSKVREVNPHWNPEGNA